VGRATLAVHLALAVSLRGLRVGLLDASLPIDTALGESGDLLFLSHPRWDHMGGLDPFLLGKPD
jgi:phosphoribosyl 1,2-cyclic phosphodiesterase